MVKEDAKGFFSDFGRFLREYGVIGLAIAVVIGTALKEFITAMVNDLIMPIVAVLTPSGNWREAILLVGPVQFGVGHFAGALIDFMIIALLIFIFAKKILKEETVAKK
jgi:large conductance mechanosensitive channel